MFVAGVVLAGILGTLVVLARLGHWILSPFHEAVRSVGAPTRFLLSDAIWLAVLLQVSFAAARLAMAEPVIFRFVLGFFVLASIAVWGGAVSALSRAGVSHALRRGVFIIILLPAVVIVMGISGAAMMMLLSVVFQPGDTHLGIVLLVPAAGISLVVPSAIGLRQLARWISAGAASPDGGKDDADQTV